MGGWVLHIDCKRLLPNAYMLTTHSGCSHRLACDSLLDSRSPVSCTYLDFSLYIGEIIRQIYSQKGDFSRYLDSGR